MSIPSNKTLAKVAIYGGVICISAVMYVRSKIQDNIRNSDHFREAMKTLRTHSGAVQLLGEPIKENGFDLSDTSRNFCTELSAQFEVNVRGPKDKGTMFFWAERGSLPESSRDWNIERLELEVKSLPDRRLVVKKPTNSEQQAAEAQS